MKRSWLLMLLVSLFTMPAVVGCHVDADDDDDDMKIKVDNEGSKRGIEVDKD